MLLLAFYFLLRLELRQIFKFDYSQGSLISIEFNRVTVLESFNNLLSIGDAQLLDFVALEERINFNEVLSKSHSVYLLDATSL